MLRIWRRQPLARVPLPPEGIAAAASVLIVIVGVFLFMDFDTEDPNRAYAVRANTPGTSFLEVGGAAPTFVAPTLDGGKFVLSDHQGQPVWINVWASWCPPCRSEMPDIDEIRTAEAENGLVFLAMNFGEPQTDIVSYLRNTGYDFTIALDPIAEFAELYDVRGLPMHIFINADGTVQSIRVGGMTRAEMEQQVANLTGSQDPRRASTSIGGVQ